MIRHHPDDALLLARAAGTLESGPQLLVNIHLETCARCRSVVRGFEDVASSLLLSERAVPVPPELFERVVATMETPMPTPVAPRIERRPALPEGMEWPRSLRRARISRWWWMAPGVRWARVTLPEDDAANLFMFRIGAGKCLPPHTHAVQELTQVLHGAFDDGRSIFGPGDFDETDDSVHHQPVVRAGGECICIAAVEGRVIFDSALARWAGAAIGL